MCSLLKVGQRNLNINIFVLPYFAITIVTPSTQNLKSFLNKSCPTWQYSLPYFLIESGYKENIATETIPVKTR